MNFLREQTEKTWEKQVEWNDTHRRHIKEPLATGGMTKEQLDIELQKSMNNIAADRVYTEDEVEEILFREFGI